MFYLMLFYPDSQGTDLRVAGSEGGQRPGGAGQEGQQMLPQAGPVLGCRDQEDHVQAAPDTHCTRTEGMAKGPDPWRATGRMSMYFVVYIVYGYCIYWVILEKFVKYP